jgi:hypothetical protein
MMGFAQAVSPHPNPLPGGEREYRKVKPRNFLPI